MLPKSGDVLSITKAASVQFEYRPILFRVISVDTKTMWDGWVYLTGYELDVYGTARERRTIYVQLAGLRDATPAAAPMDNERVMAARRRGGNQRRPATKRETTGEIRR